MYSFYEWCKDNGKTDLVDRWDNILNDDINTISYMSNKKYYFKCPNNKHESTPYILHDITSFKNKNIKCKKCNSFAQYIINTFDEEYLDKIWSNKNNKSPWDVSSKSDKSFWFNCLNNPNHTYEKSLYHFSNGSRCPYCSNHKITKENSLGVIFPEVKKIWSVQNSKSIYEYSPSSSIGVYWKCENGIHEDYYREIARSNTHNFKCPECSKILSSKSRRKNLKGLQFNELTPIGINEKLTQDKKRVYWDCLCSCGNTCSVPEDKLVSGNTKTCGNRLIHYSGSSNGNWKGGITPQLISERTSSKYNNWRDEVYKKDWYTCQCCGNSKNINKNAHHIYNFSEDESRRYLLTNGILLCDNCHSATIPTGFHYLYGTRNNNSQQLEEYINQRRKLLNINVVFSFKDYMNGKRVKPNEFTMKEETRNGKKA